MLLQMDQNVVIPVVAMGVFMTVILPQLISLRMFVRPSELSDAKAELLAHINDHFVRKDDLDARLSTFEKRLDEIKDSIKDMLNLMLKGKG